jgi:rRNA-processing protein FCF1
VHLVTLVSSVCAVVFDSSTLISLARAGLLPLLARLPVDIVVLNVVWDEVVVAGRAGQHPDAVAIADALSDRAHSLAPPARTVDDAVVLAAADDGALVCNDITLGRRARNLGARWLRTADLLILLQRAGTMTGTETRAGIESLYRAGRITDDLRVEYLEEAS